MNTWAPLWSKIVDSSLWAEPDVVVKVFLTLLAKKDSDHVVRANAYEISLWARKTEAEVLEALQKLSSPDTRRIEPQPFDGKRIQKVDDGWLVLNGERYREMITKQARKAYKRDWAAKKREKTKGSYSTGHEQLKEKAIREDDTQMVKDLERIEDAISSLPPAELLSPEPPCN
jgi:hypothetical protein